MRPAMTAALRAIETSSDKALVSAAAVFLLHEGAVLWADNKLDWDYTSVGAPLLERARQLAPEEMRLMTVTANLPRRGERPPMTIRVGGNIQSAKLTRKVNPVYPAEARERRIQGTVQFTALVGLTGEILRLQLDNGPAELVPASQDAVRQWEYKPTHINGKPCFVITRIDINYTLTR